MANSIFSEDSGEGKRKKKKSDKVDILRRMMRSHRERKRKEKIEKLMRRGDHWKGLSWAPSLLAYNYSKLRWEPTIQLVHPKIEREPNLQRFQRGRGKYFLYENFSRKNELLPPFALKYPWYFDWFKRFPRSVL